ncbi:hypothetical protein D3C86_759180 [compost metagenome]
MTTFTVDLRSKIIAPTQKIWIVHPGRNRSHIDTFEAEGAVFLEFPGLELAQQNLADDGSIRQRIRYAQAIRSNRGFVRQDSSPIRIGDFMTAADTDVAVHLRTVKHLTQRMLQGDLVIVPGRGAGGRVLFGEVAGDFLPQQSIRVPSLPFADTPVRRVTWLQARSKLEMPAYLVKYFEKPPAIAEVVRTPETEAFFDFAYDAYSTDRGAWVSLDAPKYDGSDFLSLVPPAQLIALAVSIYKAMEAKKSIAGLTYDEIIARYYDESAFAEAQIRFASPGRYNLKDHDAKLAKFVCGFVALAMTGSLLTACGPANDVKYVNTLAPHDQATGELTDMINTAANTAGVDVLKRAEADAAAARRKIGMSTPARVR